MARVTIAAALSNLQVRISDFNLSHYPNALVKRDSGSVSRSKSKRWVCCAAASMPSTMDRLEAAKNLEEWLKNQGLPEQAVVFSDCGDMDIGCVAARDLQPGDLALSIPEMYSVTIVDVTNHPVVSSAAEGRGDLVALTLWLLYERSRLQESPWYRYLRVLPKATSSPLLWTSAEQEELLKGSPFLEELKEQVMMLEEQYNALRQDLETDNKGFPLELLTLQNFKTAFCLVLSRVIYLPTAELCALVPFADFVNHEASRSWINYDLDTQRVVLKVDKSYKKGEQVYASYGQDSPTSDLLIRYGFVDDNFDNDYIEIEASLVDADPLRALKLEILRNAGLTMPQMFPVYLNRFPTQLLTYLRLSRIQDSAMFAKINFEKDIVVDQANEYEVLMLLMSECRTRLMSYSGTFEDDLRVLKNKNVSHNEKLAAKLLMKEKRILTDFMAALRNRLAPIRGIPVKSGGLKDPNSDIKEMFDMVEQVAAAPRKFFQNFLGK